jgi:hypothetical protein
MQTLPPNDNCVTFEQALMASLLVPEPGARMATVAGASKIMAQIFVAPGGGPNRRLRRGALLHEFVFVTFRGDLYWTRPAPACGEFDAATLKWAARNSKQIAIWSVPYPANRDDIRIWMLGAANAGSPFQTIIETTPSRAYEWAAAIARWKGSETEVRFFGPTGVQ